MAAVVHLGRRRAIWNPASGKTPRQIAFVVNSLLPLIDHRYRAVFYPDDKIAAALTQRFYAATGRKLSYVIGSVWGNGNLALYLADQPHLLIDRLPRRALGIDIDDLHAKGAMLVWTQSDAQVLPQQFAAIAPGGRIGKTI